MPGLRQRKSAYDTSMTSQYDKYEHDANARARPSNIVDGAPEPTLSSGAGTTDVFNAGHAKSIDYDPRPRVEPFQRLMLAVLLLTVIAGSLTSILTSSASVTSFRGRLPAANRISLSSSKLPGPLAGLDLSYLTPSYFANKRNIFNVVFVKQAWAWTTLVWLAHYLTGVYAHYTTSSAAQQPSQVPARRNTKDVLYRPVRRYAVATVYWLLFTTWFFGASISDRILVASGAQCVPSSMSSGGYLSGSLSVPDAGHAQSAAEPNVVLEPSACAYSRPDDIHVDTWSDVLEDGHDTMASVQADSAKGASAASVLSPSDDRKKSSNKAIWKGGHDISGHTFLLSLSSMLIITEIGPTLAALASSSSSSIPASVSAAVPTPTPARKRLELHVLRKAAAYAGLALVGLWWWMILMTSLYYHTPQEKLSGLLAGFGAWWSSYTLAR